MRIFVLWKQMLHLSTGAFPLRRTIIASHDRFKDHRSSKCVGHRLVAKGRLKRLGRVHRKFSRTASSLPRHLPLLCVLPSGLETGQTCLSGSRQWTPLSQTGIKRIQSCIVLYTAQSQSFTSADLSPMWSVWHKHISIARSLTSYTTV
jgi:hypothetical protein